jgi:regulator of protease activity HflC (stomatin/prohibitin superfamily)
MFSRKSPATTDDLARTDDHAGLDAEDAPESRFVSRWLGAFARMAGIYVAVIVLLAMFGLLAVSNRVFYRIESGQRGVRWSLIGGTILDRDYAEGLRMLPPWDRLYVYDVRIQEVHDDVTVLSSNGLPLAVTYSVRYQPDLQTLPYLHQIYGPTYVDKLLKPEIVGSLREVLGNYRPEEIYSRSEQGLIDEIYQALASNTTGRYVVIQTVLLEQLRLTPELEAAIDQKLVDEQNALAYEFRLNRERSEALRKEIEGQGLSLFRTASGGIDILKWRGIQATEELAKSPNTKIVVIGTGDGQLPVILGND